MENEMVKKKSWEEFRKSGLLWFINTTLHLFGWAIVFDYRVFDKEKDIGDLIGVYPARVKFRGFDNESNDDGYLKVTKYMKENSDTLLKEI